MAVARKKQVSTTSAHSPSISERIATFQKLEDTFVDSDNIEDFIFNKISSHAFLLQNNILEILFCDFESLEAHIQATLQEQESTNSVSTVLVCAMTANELMTYEANPTEGNYRIFSLEKSYSELVNFLAKVLSQEMLKETVKSHFNYEQSENESVKNILSISRELNGIRNTEKLLSLILEKAREVTEADAGSIYVIDGLDTDIENSHIVFKITQNSSKPKDLSEFKLPINDSSIVGAAVINKTPINIPDLYLLSDNRDENPFRATHDRKWDKLSGYECHSMLTLPMYDIAHNVVGVIQLINRKKDPQETLNSQEDFASQIIAFDNKSIEYAEIVAQQAGIALENALLTEEKEALFEGFVSASVKAIEQRDPTTSGHSHRVAELTLNLAKSVDHVAAGPFAQTEFSADELKELEYASLLHDFGKLGVREQVLVKSKKLYPWEFELVNERFELIRSRIELEHAQEVLKFLKNPEIYPPGTKEEDFQTKKINRLKQLELYFDFIVSSNEPTVLEQEGFEKLSDIANLNFKDTRGKTRPYLLKHELKALRVSRGSLTSEEFAEIQSHVEHTYEFLRKIPWGRKFANVPQIAAKHHEKLDGSGYPNNAAAAEIPIQSRMMTIADIFDALTASDRPYKRAVPAQRALEIIEMEVKAKKCDPELFKIFTEADIYKSIPDL